MSNEAQGWASKLDVVLGSSTRFVLMALANYANDDNLAWVSRHTIVKYTELSPATVTRALRDLEARGLIEREERFRDNGSRTTDMIRLLVGCTPRPATPPDHSDEGGTPHHDEAPSSPRAGPLITVMRPEPSLEPSIEDSPQAPQGAGARNSTFDGEGEGGAPDTQFDVLWAQYGPDPTASKAKALRAWARLGASERAQALTLLPRFLDHCRAAKRKICDPSTYLGERRWEGLANLPAAAPKAEEAPARPVEADPVKRAVLWALNDKADRAEWHFVEQGSDAWEAWRQAFGAAGFGHQWMAARPVMVPVPGGGFTKRLGRSFPLRYPPKADGSGTGPPDGAVTADEMAEFVNSGG